MENNEMFINTTENEQTEKEIAVFTNPKPVIIRRTSEIITTQAIICVAVVISMLLLNVFAPEVYGVIDSVIRECMV